MPRSDGFDDVQLATLAKEVPHGNDWTYELKWRPIGWCSISIPARRSRGAP